MATTVLAHADRLFPPVPQPTAPQFLSQEEKAISAKTATGRLSSWKEIAGYLRQGVRTVQRWELECKLPVYRINHSPRSPVFAFPSEIDAWLRERKNIGNPVSAARNERRTAAALVGNSKVLMSRCAALQEKLQTELERFGKQMRTLRALRRVKSADYSSIVIAIDAEVSEKRFSDDTEYDSHAPGQEQPLKAARPRVTSGIAALRTHGV